MYGQTNMKRAITLAKINHPWNRYNMRMLRSWPINIPNMNKMRPYLVSAISHLPFVTFYSYLVSWLAMIWHVHIIPISRMVDFCESYSPFHVCLAICPFAHLVYAASHLSFVAFSYGQTKMKRAITLAKNNHPWNRYNRRMLRSWPIKIPNMNKMRQKTND
jgi:hypothetical protein